MKVSAINNVKYNNINFEGKKDKQVQPKYSTTPLKAVPVIVLMAMSPMNAPLANAQQNGYVTRTEYAQTKDKTIATMEYTNATYFGKSCNIDFVSTDYDDNSIEKILLNFPEYRYKNVASVSGEKIYSKQYTLTSLELKNFKKVNVNDVGVDGSVMKSVEYYVEGSAKKHVSPWLNNKTNDLVSKSGSGFFVIDNYDIRISKEFFEDLQGMLGDDIPCLTKTEKRSH